MLPSYYEFHNPTKIISGFRALENLPYELEMLHAKKPFIITDQGIIKAGLLKNIKNWHCSKWCMPWNLRREILLRQPIIRKMQM